jgi:hypothetical protein
MIFIELIFDQQDTEKAEPLLKERRLTTTASPSPPCSTRPTIGHGRETSKKKRPRSRDRGVIDICKGLVD